MTDEQIKQINEFIERATEQAFDYWAVEHPSLAAVINRIRLTERTAQSLRQSPEYRQALAAYRKGRDELAFFARLIELAEPILRAVIGG